MSVICDGVSSPCIIRRLDEVVVNRIAAGEVIQRPSNALKELLENSLDAKSTKISVVVQSGGLQLLQITDNGTGIRKDDLEIVAERFTTSKLQEFEDLSSIQTFGFRGEALASISHVAHLSVVTKTRDSICGYRASYSDGKLIDGPPKPCAANQGTQIIAKDLFFNVPIRKRALKSGSEEFARVADVISKYAIHNSGVAFSLKKFGDNASCVQTTAQSSVVENISQIYGTTIGRELVDLELISPELGFKANGSISNVNFNVAKKFNFLLFINNRLVECSALRKAIEMVYAAYLPKSRFAFVYLSLSINPQNLDVNVHPTKCEVHFLHQDAIVDKIQQAINAKLLGSDQSRAFYAQKLLVQSGASIVPKIPPESSLSPAIPAEVTAPKFVVRTDSKTQKIDKFIHNTDSVLKDPIEFEKLNNKHELVPLDDQIPNLRNLGVSTKPQIVLDSQTHSSGDKFVAKDNPKRKIKLFSIKELLEEVSCNCHSSLRKLINGHSFVGCVNRQFALIQHEIGLYLVNTVQLSRELFYQILLRDIGNFDVIRLDPPISIAEAVLIGLEHSSIGWTEDDGNKEEMSKYVAEFLSEKSAMLDEYFSIQIDTELGMLCSIPLILADFVPFLTEISTFLIQLTTNVDWDSEKPFFRTFCRELASFYAISTSENSRYDTKQFEEHNGTENDNNWKYIVEHVIYPACRVRLMPPSHFADDNSTFVQVANLPDLYKVFERC